VVLIPEELNAKIDGGALVLQTNRDAYVATILDVYSKRIATTLGGATQAQPEPDPVPESEPEPVPEPPAPAQSSFDEGVQILQDETKQEIIDYLQGSPNSGFPSHRERMKAVVAQAYGTRRG